MQLRSCDNTHFIRTIRGGLVIKVCNINAHGKSAVKFKSLKDVYDKENEIRRSSADCVFDHERGRCESKGFPLADGVHPEQKSETHKYGPAADSYMDSDLDGHITLKQLKRQVLSKKRKGSLSVKRANFKTENTSGDESDLHEPLVNWKIKRSKISTSKRRRVNPTNASLSTIAIGIKCEADSVSEGSPLAGESPVVYVKVESQDSEMSEHENQKLYNDDSSTGIHELQNGALCVYREHLSCRSAQNTFSSSEGSSYQWDYPEPVSVILPIDETSFSVKSLEQCCNVFPEFHPLALAVNEPDCESSLCSSPQEESNSEVCTNGKPTNTLEISEQTSNSDSAINSRNMVSVLSADTDKRIYCFIDCMVSLKNDNSTLTLEDSIVDQEPPSISPDPTVNDSSNNGCQFEDVEERPASVSLSIDTTSTSSSKNRICGGSEAYHPPRRLPLTRKAISPSSQERLCMAMNSILLHGNDNRLKTKQKLFVKEARERDSTVRSKTEHAKISGNGQFRQVTQQNITSSRRAIMKSKGNLEGPRFARALPDFSSGTSIQGCSRSAITFSQRQMQDTESLALKLMNELKSMKNFVEQKLLFEAYRSASLKNDADEVKSAINNATKAEETARKWLSIMARDCNRFCKIMEMTPESATATKDNATREKKISFADEAGEKLCQVRFFEDGETFNASHDVQR